ncbi:MAG: hypothetical protein RBR41_03230 [Desulfovibrio sp.]|nr:hypothetical protein [Desulfovibrio sp.]MDY0258664.1 hypothetical protein [Desulfovibrio sp.]
MPNADYPALVMFIEDNWDAFVQYCDEEKDAEETLATLKREAGMS